MTPSQVNDSNGLVQTGIKAYMMGMQRMRREGVESAPGLVPWRGKGRSGTGVFAWCLSEFVGIEYRQPNSLGPGTPAVDARLHFTPNPRSTPGIIRAVRLVHHVGLQAGLAEI